MNLKQTLIELSSIFQSVENEGFEILKQIRPLVKNIDQGMSVQRILENKKLDWENDLQIIFNLAQEYNIDLSKFTELREKYVDSESRILEKKEKIAAELGLKNINIENFSISGETDKEITLNISVKKGEIEIYTYPLKLMGKREIINKDLRDELYFLETKTNNILEKRLKDI